MWSGYVYAGRVFCDWNTQSKKHFMRKTFLKMLDIINRCSASYQESFNGK